MNQLSITKDKVLAAASKCETAKATLKVLFPDVFEDEYYEFPLAAGSLRKILGVEMFVGTSFAPDGFINKCLILDSAYDWQIVDAKHGYKALTAKKKA